MAQREWFLNWFFFEAAGKICKFVAMESERYSQFISVGSFTPGCVEGFDKIGCHGSKMLWRVVRHGHVWFAKSYDSETDVAEGRIRLQKEYEVMVRLNHPGVVRAGWLDDVEGIGPCLAMDMVEGETLDCYLNHASKRERRLISDQLLEAVGYIHNRGVCHLDLKPQNVMVEGSGSSVRVKIIDFGMSDWSGNALFKMPGGTRGYSDPHQFEPEYRATPRSDVYSLGKLLQLIGCGGGYAIVAKKALSTDFADRPADGMAMIEAVASWRLRLRLIGLLVALVCVVALLSFLLWPNERAEEVKSVAPTVSDIVADETSDSVHVIEAPAFERPHDTMHGSEELSEIKTKDATVEVGDSTEYERLIGQWKQELERRLMEMKTIADIDSLSIEQRRTILYKMGEDMLDDTEEFFRPLKERMGRSEVRSYPIYFGTFYEPAFEDVKRRMRVVYNGLSE